MPVLQVESYDQDLKVLLISRESSLSDLVAQYFFDQKISIDRSPLTHADSYNFVKSLVNKNEYYKIVVLVTSFEDILAMTANNSQLVELLNNIHQQKIYIIRLSSKASCDDELCLNWKNQLNLEDELINNLYSSLFANRLILVQDLVAEDHTLMEPYKTMFQSVANGYLIDPQAILTPIEEQLFFSTISRELLKPDKKHLLISGSKITSEEFLLKTQLQIKKYHQKDLEIVEIESTSNNRLEKKKDVLEVVVSSDVDRCIEKLVKNTNLNTLGIDPKLLKKVKSNESILKTSSVKPYKNIGEDYFFEEPLKQKRENISKQVNSNNNIENTDKSIKTTAVYHNNQESILSKNNLPEEKIDSSLGKLFSKKRTEQKTKRREQKASIISRIRKKSKNKQIIFAVGALVLSFGGVVFISLLSLAASFNNSQQKVGNNIKLLANNDYQNLSQLTAVGWQVELLDSLFELQLIDKNKELIELNDKLVETSRLLMALDLRSLEIYSQVFNNSAQNNSMLQKGDYHQLIEDNGELLTRLSSHLVSFQAELESLNSLMFNQDLQAQIELVKEEVNSNYSKIQILSQLNNDLPTLLSIDGQKNYYILLQDNQELRPTGGFPQALARLVVEEGRVADYQVFSVGWIDSKTLGNISSLPEVEEILGEPRLHMRDANWDPDLGSSASQISWYIKEVLNMPFDGILVINYDQVRELLTVFEELELVEYNEILTPQNLFTRLEAKAADDLQQDLEKNFHTAVLDNLLQRTTRATDQEVRNFLGTLLHSLRNQRASVAMIDVSLNQTLNQLGWTGSILSPDCPVRFGEGCKTDYLYQVEANVGVNKVNRYVNSRVNHLINIGETSVSHHRKIIYNNKSHSSSWPMGNYRVYVRLYLDKDSVIERILVNGGQLPTDEVREYDQHQRKVVGVLFEVPVGQEVSLDIHYSTPRVIAKGDSYFFFEQPQPGLGNRLSTISVTHPMVLTSELISPMVEVNQNKIIVTSEVGTGFVAIKFAEK